MQNSLKKKVCVHFQVTLHVEDTKTIEIKFEFRFSSFSLPYCSLVKTWQFKVVWETGVSVKNDSLLSLTLSHWQLSHVPQSGFKPSCGERQLTVSDHALDQMAIRAGPSWSL